jgi:hypothetical protein
MDIVRSRGKLWRVSAKMGTVAPNNSKIFKVRDRFTKYGWMTQRSRGDIIVHIEVEIVLPKRLDCSLIRN